MNQELLDSALEADAEVSDLYPESFDYEMDEEEELDDIFEALMEDDDEDFDDDEDDDFSERRRRRRRRRSRKKGYRTDPRVKRDLVALKRKNRHQDKLIYQNRRRSLQNRKRSLANARVNRVQNKRLGQLHRQQKLDGALEIARSISAADNGLDIDLVQLFQGAVKSGMFGDLSGALGNPALMGGIALLLNNRQLLGGLVKGS
ncbi:hypothetical protein [Microbulbifer discodermiae]|uniref:hypothetical protein n=1 Tax=Microbulbifer sp. 2201CG32-9 TaxID=3232309 RepID=UPI00345BA05F